MPLYIHLHHTHCNHKKRPASHPRIPAFNQTTTVDPYVLRTLGSNPNRINLALAERQGLIHLTA